VTEDVSTSGLSSDVEDMFEVLKRLGERAKARVGEAPRICVIGGGIAGLVAAYELSQANDRVTLLEGSSRWGGRLETVCFKGARAELGAMRIPVSHLYTLHYVKDVCGVDVRPFVSENRLLVLGDRRETFDRLSAGVIGAPFRVFTLPTRGTPRQTGDPFLMLDNLVQPFVEQFDDDDWDAGYGTVDLQSSQLARQADSISVWQYMSGTLRLPGPIPGAWRSAPRVPRPDWEYVGRATGHLWMEKASLLQWAVDGPRAISGAKVEPESGMTDVVEKLVSLLEDGGRAQLHKNSKALRVLQSDGDAIRVDWEGGTDRFEFVICAIPAPAAAAITFDPPLAPEVHAALTNLSYIPMAKAVAHCSKRRWELVDGFFGGGSYTDHPNQQVWYPSDNAKQAVASASSSSAPPADLNDEPYTNMMSADPYGGHLPDEGPWVAKDSDASASDGALTAAYVWGSNARRFIAMTDGEREDVIRTSLEVMHPGISDDIQTIRYATFGGSDLGGGAFAYFGPGEQSRYQTWLASPHPHDVREPRVFFAGEHLLPMHGWMQTSIQTALAAVARVLSSPLR
jgi:monoamine oxidase